MRRIIVIGGLVAAVLVFGLSAQGNLILNGSFESGLTSWQSWGPGNMQSISGWGWEQDGSTMVRMWTDAGLYQDFSVNPGATYEISAYACHAEWDPILWGSTGRVGGVSLEWRDASDQLIGVAWQYSFGSANQTAGEELWYLAESGSQQAPDGAAVGRVIVNIWNDGTGSGSAFFDNVNVIPEPTAVALLGLGGLLFVFRRKARR